MNKLLRAGSLLGVLWLAGCGTIGNLANDPRIYGGARYDVDEMGATGPCSSGIVAVFDLPFSVVLDTAVLPFTLIYELVKPDPLPPPPPRRPEPSMPNPNTR
jgi:uncharacterized protein YceK